MRKILLILAGLSLACPALGQDAMMIGAGSPSKVGAGAYQGPGDVISGALMWAGLRAYSLAKAGNRAANVCNAGDANCADVNTLANGKFDVATAQGAPLNCGGTGGTCTIKILYDQTGNLNCSPSAACDLSNSTAANRPTLAFNCVGTTNPCMIFNGTTQLLETNGLGFTTTQPLTISGAAKYTNPGTQGPLVSTSNGATPSIGFDASGTPATAWAYAGTLLSESASDNAWHALQGVFNGTSSDINVDGTPCASSCNTGTGVPAGSSIVLGNGFSEFMQGDATEVGIWGSNFSSGQSSSMSSNQHSFWGF